MFVVLTSGGRKACVNMDNVSYFYPFQDGTMLVFNHPIESRGTLKMMVDEDFETVRDLIELEENR